MSGPSHIFNKRAEALSNSKDEFFDMISLLIDRCESSESEQNTDIIDNCELFRVKIIMLWKEFMNLEIVNAPLSAMETHYVEQVVSEIVETDGGFDSDVLTIVSSDVNYNVPAHYNMNSDYVEGLDESENKLTLPLNAPPATGDIKKDAIVVEAPNVSSQVKLEPDTVEMENKPIIEK